MEIEKNMKLLGERPRPPPQLCSALGLGVRKGKHKKVFLIGRTTKRGLFLLNHKEKNTFFSANEKINEEENTTNYEPQRYMRGRGLPRA